MLLASSSLTIYEVEQLKDTFKKLLLESKIIIDFKDVIKIDMSAIQLLISLKKSADLKNIPFEIININDEISSSFNISGTAFTLGV